MEKRGEIPRAEDFRFCSEVQVRFRDLDAMKHVNNAVYFTYFEIARTGYMKAIGNWTKDEGSFRVRFPFILLQVACRYVSPARMEDELRVHLRTSRMGNKSFEFDYLITAKADGRVVAVGDSVQVHFDYGAGKTLPIPDSFRALIEDYEGPETIEAS